MNKIEYTFPVGAAGAGASPTLGEIIECAKKEGEAIHLAITGFNEASLVSFLDFIRASSTPLPFKKLSLEISGGVLEQAQFLELIKAINAKGGCTLELGFPPAEAANTVSAAAIQSRLTTIAPEASYPIRILPDTLEQEGFRNTIIANIQKKYRETPATEAAVEAVASTEYDDKKIKLKTFIKNRQSSTTAKEKVAGGYVELEVQHVQTVEHDIAHEEVVEVQAETELHEVQRYEGPLVDYKAFSEPAYRAKALEAAGGDNALIDTLYGLLKTELFANLPHAIKYLSPAAAEQLARHLPEWVTLNKENLPHGFLLKKLPRGIWVLDYDPALENEKVDAFTPLKSADTLELEPIYTIELKPQDLRRCGVDASLDRYSKKLVNLWIKYGDEGLKSFSEGLIAHTKDNPEVRSFMLEHYLSHFPQWDHLYKHPTFFKSLERMSHYDKAKLDCLKRFLIDTGSSRYDLSQTLDAFEVFGAELSRLCIEQKVDIARINEASWSTPKGGQPMVYMERMLVLLRNARTLDEQLTELKAITLDNYGAYYASRFEGFRLVSESMKLIYDEPQVSALPFHQERKFYQTSLFKLLNGDAFGHSAWSGHEFSYRFIGLQTTGITLSSLRKQYADWLGSAGRSDGLGRRYTPKPLDIFHALFFISHERFNYYPLHGLWRAIEFAQHRTGDTELYTMIYKKLEEFYQYGIKFDQTEGSLMLEVLSSIEDGDIKPILGIVDTPIPIRMTSFFDEDRDALPTEDGATAAASQAEADAKRLRIKQKKTEIVDTLFKQLQLNKLSVLKLFQALLRIGGERHRLTLGYALDTAEFLAEDPLVKEFYADDLLLFSGLINAAAYDGARHYWSNNESMRPTVERVRGYLKKAATNPPNNLQYAIQLMLNAQKCLDYGRFLADCARIEALGEFDMESVHRVLGIPGLTAPDFKPWMQKDIIIQFIIELKRLKPEDGSRLELSEEASSALYRELASLTTDELKERFNSAWGETGTWLMSRKPFIYKTVLQKLYDAAISASFASSASDDLLALFRNKIKDMPEFKVPDNFEKLDFITQQFDSLASLLSDPAIIKKQEELITLFKDRNFALFDHKTLYALFTLLISMPLKDYEMFLKPLLDYQQSGATTERVLNIINALTFLNTHDLPTEYMAVFTKLAIANPSQDMLPFAAELSLVYKKDNQDPVLGMLMSNPSLSFSQMTQILYLSKKCTQDRAQLTRLLVDTIKEGSLDAVIAAIVGDSTLTEPLPERRQKILDILIKSQALSRRREELNYKAMIEKLAKLSDDDLTKLHTFYESCPVSFESLLQSLPNDGKISDFAAFISSLEKFPFGARDFAKQFSLHEVERVVNESKDLLNGTPYTYHYRKQLMEAFLFVNAIGEHLPVYDGKPAKDLTNAEIKAFFLKIKSSPDSYSPTARRLLALGLLREAMYRSTGEFPYSTQMLALIDGMMHEGDFISNIDTGQGKSLIDVMKATFLWLESDRVDLTTSSLVDARRDIANYGPFLKLLGVPYSESPISATSEIDTFKPQGINFSTFSQLSLFFAKAQSEGAEIDTAKRVSLVTNESDYAVLDDAVIYRFAVADGSGINYGQEWMYYAINEFVRQPSFTSQDTTSAQEDINALKTYLRAKATALGKSPKVIAKFSDTQYLTWLESALMVNYVLKENEDYVIPEAPEQKIINGKPVSSKVVKVLMKDGKVSPDSTFGNGMQQLLYARLNRERGTDDFVIEPQHRTIVSSNNKNLLDYYRSKKGFIWGSSGTVGSSLEIREQYAKYGFEFGKSEPHQRNRVKHHVPALLADEDAQFKELASQLTKSKSDAPCLVFFKDIETATRFHAFFKGYLADASNKLGVKPEFQLYTGLGKEEEYIARAAKPSMITITTSALGRNTDIPYDKAKGLRVWHTSVDSIRRAGQKSGRTGRQGSAGEVHYLFNAKDLSARTVEEVQAAIDKATASERMLNEELYDILGYLLTQVKGLAEDKFTTTKIQFLKDAWSQFSVCTETKYKEIRRSGGYDRSAFIKLVVKDFHKLTTPHLKAPMTITAQDVEQALAKQYEQRAPYYINEDQVKLSDCTPPVTIAYHLLQGKVGAASASTSGTVDSVKAQLKDLFKKLNRGNFTAENSKYLHYLYSSPATQAEIVRAHQEFLAEYLGKAAKKDAWQKCFGVSSQLSSIASNPAYILMFHAFARIPKAGDASPQVSLDLIKSSVTVLLDDYLQSSWFISKERKQWASELKGKIAGIETLEDLVKAIITAQIATAKSDIAKNKQASKPQHLFGHSRYQETLSRALNLATALGGQTDISKELTSELMSLLAGKAVDTAKVTTDEVQSQVASTTTVDSYNKKVVERTLKEAIEALRRDGASGMSGREEPSGGSSTGGGDGGSDPGPRS